ncbi:Putative lipase, secreted, alpha/Beta hydrolase [Septoria linicola]|uniref:Lipase, secreted, alpha/Beta hydrolase n=1 Tax=Septoria linicola TaxID=215465 RepID=A0A9Q9AMG9_9PEZI|nr:putative lipase, secreted, alpha/Beta hydrolase [Septoria linicola]USW50814.1 Putative lipase, secreted, alpha/Beta hydrolase [Septoria linicola]
MRVSNLAPLASLVASSSAWYTNPITKLMRESAPAVDILAPRQDPWYSAPPNFERAAPGAILKVRAAPGNITTVQGNSSEAYNILYRTTDSRYLPTWAVTTLFVPNTTVLFGNDRLLSYQVPYDSADVDASPSYAMYGVGLPDVGAALGKGWYVSVPDYEGPLASFTAGVMSGHATLDSVRAVLNSGFGLRNGTRYAMWGYSGGALASEWAAELQVQYAQDLEFAGAALGGLTPNVSSVLLASTNSIFAGLIPAGILGLASQFPELEEFVESNLKEEGEFNRTTFLMARNQTLIEAIGAFNGQDITDYFEGGVETLFSPISQYVINRDGIMGYHGVPQMPILAYKAIQDEISPVNDTDALVERYCKVGATINYERNTVGNHGGEATNGNARAMEFLDSVLGGSYNATGCQIQNVTVGS